MRFLRREVRDAAVTWLEDGEAVLDHLHATTSRPDLVLLDLGLARLDGREVLAATRADPDLRGIAVVLLTASSLARTRELAADGYLGKPVDAEIFWAVIRLCRRRGLIDPDRCRPAKGALDD